MPWKNRIQKRLLPRLFILTIGNGWQFAEKNHPEWGKLAVCVNQEEWQDYCVEPPCGQVSQFHGKILFCYSIWYRFFFISPIRFEKYHDYTFFSIFEIITKLNFQKTLIWAFDFFPQVDFFRILAQSIIKYLNSSIIIIFIFEKLINRYQFVYYDQGSNTLS